MWYLCLLLAGSIVDMVNGHLDAINRHFYLPFTHKTSPLCLCYFAYLVIFCNDNPFLPKKQIILFFN